MLQMAFFGGLAISFIGKGMLPQKVQEFMAENQLGTFGLLFACNIMSGQLINTGAFEVTAGNQLIHSKLTIPGHGKCETEQASPATEHKPSSRHHSTSRRAPCSLRQELDAIIEKIRVITG